MTQEEAVEALKRATGASAAWHKQWRRIWADDPVKAHSFAIERNGMKDAFVSKTDDLELALRQAINHWAHN